MGPYTWGQTLVMTLTVTNASGALVDPATVTCEVQAPGEPMPAPVQCAVTRVSAGVYSAQLVLTDDPGSWTYRFETTSPVGAQERVFYVNGSPFTS